MILDSNHLKQIVLPKQVILVKVDETCGQIDLLKKDLKEIPNVKIIMENGRNHRLIENILRNNQIPVLLLGKNSEETMTENVKCRITNVIRSKDYMSQEAIDIFIF